MPEETPTPTPTPVETVAPVEPPAPDTSVLDALTGLQETLEVFHTTALLGLVLLLVCVCIITVRAL